MDSPLKLLILVGADAILVGDNGALLGLDLPGLHLLATGGANRSHAWLAAEWASRAGLLAVAGGVAWCRAGLATVAGGGGRMRGRLVPRRASRRRGPLVPHRAGRA